MKRIMLYLACSTLAGIAGAAHAAAEPSLRAGVQAGALEALNRFTAVVQRDLEMRLNTLLEPRLFEAESQFGIDGAADPAPEGTALARAGGGRP